MRRRRATFCSIVLVCFSFIKYGRRWNTRNYIEAGAELYSNLSTNILSHKDSHEFLQLFFNWIEQCSHKIYHQNKITYIFFQVIANSINFFNSVFVAGFIFKILFFYCSRIVFKKITVTSFSKLSEASTLTFSFHIIVTIQSNCRLIAIPIRFNYKSVNRNRK